MSLEGPTPEEIAADHARRVRMTTSCRDSDRLPKVEGAGEVFGLEDGTQVQRMHNGLLVLEGGYLGSWTTEIISGLRGHHEPQEEVAFAAVLDQIAATEPSPTMVELGSYWAYYSMWFQQRTGGRVVDLEPDPAYLEVGRRNMALNDLTATFVPGAIGAQEAPAVEFEAESTGELVTVPAFTLASLMEQTGLERVSLVLADIQGFERPLLDSIAELVAQGRLRFMVVSTHHHSISGRATTHQDALARIAELGGHVLAEHTVGESYSGDGLIVLSFDDRDRDLTIEISHARYKESYFGELEPELQTALESLAATRELLEKTQDLAERSRELIENLRASVEAAEAALDAERSAAAQASARPASFLARARAALGRQ